MVLRNIYAKFHEDTSSGECKMSRRTSVNLGDDKWIVRPRICMARLNQLRGLVDLTYNCTIFRKKS